MTKQCIGFASLYLSFCSCPILLFLSVFILFTCPIPVFFFFPFISIQLRYYPITLLIVLLQSHRSTSKSISSQAKIQFFPFLFRPSQSKCLFKVDFQWVRLFAGGHSLRLPAINGMITFPILRFPHIIPSLFLI